MLAALTTCLLLLTTSHSEAAPQVSKSLTFAQPDGSRITNLVVVRVEEPAALRTMPTPQDARLVEELSAKLGIGVFAIDARSAADVDAVARELRDRDSVVWAHPVAVRQLGLRGTLPNDELLADQWHLDNTGQVGTQPGVDVGVREAWQHSAGAGQIIAIIDNGSLSTHPDLAPNFRGGYDPVLDLASSTAGDPASLSANPHGTATAGLAVARGNNGIGVAGVAHEANFVAINLLRYNTLTDVEIARAYLWAADEAGASVISNSYGPSDRYWAPFDLPPLLRDVMAYVRTEARGGRGSLMVWSSGNGAEPVDFDGFAASDWSLAVGAVSAQDVLAPYSDFGSRLDLVAPSSGLASDPRITTTVFGEQLYTSSFGATSAAAPMVAGAAALVFAANPQLAADDVEAILKRTAFKAHASAAGYDARGHSRGYGHGRVDAGAAVALPLAGDGGPPALIDDLRLVRRADAHYLEFSATGDDSTFGTTLRYDIRITTGTLTAENWSTAAQWRDAPLPREAGSIERLRLPVIGGPGDVVSVALRAFDKRGAGSPLSQVVIIDKVAKENSSTLLQAWDFESDIAGSMQTGQWERRAGLGVDGSAGIADTPDGNYTNDADSFFALPPVTVRGATGLRLRFDERFRLEPGTGAATGIPYDKGRVEVSLDGGLHWQPTIEISNGYQEEWRERTVSLAMVDGADSLALRFRLTSDVAIFDDGWYIDNVRLEGHPGPPDAALDVIDALLGWRSPAGEANGDALLDAGDAVAETRR